MDDYRLLNIPDSCFVGNTIFKKLFYDNADLTTGDKKLFAEVIKKITWIYCLKPETINISPYKDEVRDYPEIELIEVELNRDHKLSRISQIIMRTIPYPMLLVFKLNDKKQLHLAQQRISLSDSSKNTIEDQVTTDWLFSGDSLFEKLDIEKMSFTNFYALYSDLIDKVSIHIVSDLLEDSRPISGQEARQLAKAIEEIEEQINGYRNKIKKETQFNRKMELNIVIKGLEEEKAKLLGGNTR